MTISGQGVLPKVLHTDPLIDWGVPLPPFSLRNTMSGVVHFRTFTIPVSCEDSFWRSHRADRAAWARRGFRVASDERGSAKIWRVEQWLRKGDDGSYTLTPMGAEIYRDLLEAQAPKAPVVQQAQLVLVEDLKLPELSEWIRGRLLPYQITPARQVLRALLNGRTEWGFPGAVNTSDTGLGKTFMTVAVYMALLEKNPELELIVLCPPAARAEWMACFKHFGTPLGGIVLETYEAIRGNWRPELVGRDAGSKMFRWKSPRTKLLVMDEAHAVRHSDTLTFEVCAAAIAQGMMILAVSATLATSPLEFRFVGRIIGLHNGGKDWERFLYAHGCTKSRQGNWSWRKDPRDILKIHRTLFPSRGCRVTVEDTGGDAPETEITLVTLGGGDAEEAFRRRREHVETVCMNLEREKGSAAAAAYRRSHVTKMWQDEECATAEAALPRMKAALARGESVVVFCNFDDSRKIVERGLNTTDGVHGKKAKHLRPRHVEDFQANRIRVLVNNFKSGGASISMHDKHGGFPRRSFLFINPNAVLMKQGFGRVARLEQKSKSHQEVIAFRGGITDGFSKQMRKKLANISTLNDGVAVRIF